MIESVFQIFAALIKALFSANGAAEAEEEAIMEAEARLARMRAERKFS